MTVATSRTSSPDAEPGRLRQKLWLVALSIGFASLQVSADASGEPIASENVRGSISLADPSRQYVDVEGRPLPFATEDEILDFLKNAAIVEQRAAPKGINKIQRLTLQRGPLRVYAAFRDVEISVSRHRLPNGRVTPNAKDSYRFDPAAYWVSRLLGLDAVPPAVLRRHRGRRGSLQLWIGNVIDETDRVERDVAPHPVLWHWQGAMRQVFDNLIANYDRNQTNILMDPETWRVWLIDHGRAFLTDGRLLQPQAITGCERELFERLRELDEETAREHLDEYLDRYEIKALLRRRDEIVERLDARIAELGESSVLFDL